MRSPRHLWTGGWESQNFRPRETDERAWLGVETSDPVNTWQPPGAEVQSVAAGGPAERAGVRHDDVITAIDGRPVNDCGDVSRIVSARKPGDEVDICIDRVGELIALSARLEARPARTP